MHSVDYAWTNGGQDEDDRLDPEAMQREPESCKGPAGADKRAVVQEEVIWTRVDPGSLQFGGAAIRKAGPARTPTRLSSVHA